MQRSFPGLKPIIYTRAFIFLAYYIIRAYSWTFRLTVENEWRWKRLLKEKPVILCTWHQQFVAVIRHFKTYARFNPGLMISQSKDGDLISGVANKTGWHSPRGSSSKGGREALTEMIDHLRTYGFGAHILDGPRGPFGVVKPGILKMAHSTGAFIVPFHVSAQRAWFFKSWDRFMLPKPFSRVRLVFGRPLQFQPSSSDADFEQQRQYLETLMRHHLVSVHV